MPYTATTPALPLSGNGLLSRQCSRAAAAHAVDARAWKSARYLAWLQAVGRATDHEAAAHFTWPLSSVCSIRNGLGDQIVALGTQTGLYGRPVTIWGPA